MPLSDRTICLFKILLVCLFIFCLLVSPMQRITFILFFFAKFKINLFFFTNIILNPSGNVSICRQKGTEHIVGSLNDNTIEEIWNSDYLKKWRNEFLTGEISICKSEIANDSCHLSSGNYFYFSSVELDTTQSDLPMKLTANFNGQCNLKCKMCDVWVMENGYYDRINY